MCMNLFDGMMSASKMSEGYEVDRQEAQDALMYPDPNQWVESYNNFKMEPVLFPNVANVTVSPYPEDNWGDMSAIMMSMGVENLQFPQRENKIDPNKIFNSDIAALRSLAADQMRVTKLFEKRLTESLKEKDKFGLNEADILAMQALTAARSAVTAINKEQIQIKKNIADIRLKQQQNKYANGGGTNVTTSNESGYTSSAQIGRQIMDDIFNMPGNTVDTNVPYVNGSNNDLDMASRVLDDIVGAANGVAYENMNPTTYAVMDQYGNHIGYETHDGEGNIIENYDNPTSIVKEFDRDAMQAIDEMERQFPVIIK